MPSVTVDVDVDLGEFCDIGELKLIIGYALVALDKKISDAAASVNKDLDLFVTPGDEHCPLPACDQKYLKWIADRSAEGSPAR